MSIYNKVRSVNAILQTASKEVRDFQKLTGIYCIDNCHSCCTKKDIYATELEFYPLAYNLFKNKKAYQVLEELQNQNEQELSNCILYKPGLFEMKFGCTEYVYRGLICRLFGYSFSADKYGNKKFMTCKTIKNHFSTKVEELSQIKKKPGMQKYYSELSKIDFYLANKLVPINQAIQRAIEKIVFHYELRKKKPA